MKSAFQQSSQRLHGVQQQQHRRQLVQQARTSAGRWWYKKKHERELAAAHAAALPGIHRGPSGTRPVSVAPMPPSDPAAEHPLVSLILLPCRIVAFMIKAIVALIVVGVMLAALLGVIGTLFG